MNWMKYRYLYFLISLIVIVPGVISLFKYGLKLSVEFTGGSVIQVANITLPAPTINERLKDFGITSVSQTADLVNIRLMPISQEQLNQIKTILSVKDEDVVNFETVGPVLGFETIKKTLTGIVIASTLILIFIARAFREIKYGIAAVIAMFHDTLILIGVFSLLGHFFGLETDLLFVTAVLTTLSFSVHDTIVVYDRIRELSRHHSGISLQNLANKAITETIVRSLNNSLTIILMLTSLFLLGGETTRNFALALLIGTVAGTYSSPFTATPLLVVWDQLSSSLRRKK